MDKATRKQMRVSYLTQERSFRAESPAYDKAMRAFYRIKKHKQYGSRAVKNHLKRMGATLAASNLEKSLLEFQAKYKRP